MCEIFYYPEGVEVDADDLKRSAEHNDEGFGCVIMHDGALMVMRSNHPSLIGAFAGMRRDLPGPAAFHCRLATTGEVSLSQMHPVQVGDSETYLFHQGTLPEPYVSEARHHCRSDTQEFADVLDPIIREYEGEVAEPPVAVLNNLIGKDNKMLIMTSDPRYAEQAYVLNRDQWMVTPYGALTTNADHLGKGKGWDEALCPDGTLYRWRIRQPGQCAGCDLYGCSRGCMPKATPPAYRNETESRARVREQAN